MPATRHSSVYEAMESGKFSDLTLCLQDGTEIKCHRVIVCTQCEFFDIAVKPGQFQESSGIIKLENDPPQAIRCLVEFLYTGKYTTDHGDVDILELPAKEYDEAMFAHARVYIVSVIYRIPELQKRASKFIRLALTDRTLGIFPELFKSIDSSVPASVCSLREELIKLAEKHVVELTSGDHFRDMMDAAPELLEKLVHDLVKSRQQAQSSLKDAERLIDELKAQPFSTPTCTYRCPNCSETFNTVMPALCVKVGCPHCGVTRHTNSWGLLKLKAWEEWRPSSVQVDRWLQEIP